MSDKKPIDPYPHLPRKGLYVEESAPCSPSKPTTPASEKPTPKRAAKGTFDRAAYQRELMRKLRAKAKASSTSSSPPAAEKPAPSTRRASLASIRASNANAASPRGRKKPPITLAKSAAPENTQREAPLSAPKKGQAKGPGRQKAGK
jgi:hypothetical protein